MSSNKFLIIIYTVTSGQHYYEELGSDEQEIVLFAWLVLDIINLKIIDVKCKYVKPKYFEKLSETAKNEFQLTEQLIEENGQYLENVLEEFDQYVRNKYYDNGKQFNIVTDGQNHLRQVLHSECSRLDKNINLPEYFYTFFDLKKEFRKFLRDNLTDNSSNHSDLIERSSTSSIDYQSNDSLQSSNNQQQNLFNSTSSTEFDQLIGDTQLKMNSIFPNLLNPTIIQKFTIPQMLKELSLEPDSSAEIVIQSVKNMANIIINLISNGHVFNEPETINARYEPAICSKNEIVDNMTIVRARGLPFKSSDQDIARFFKGLNIHKGGIALCLSSQGRRNGEALIRFSCVEHRELALKRHRHHLGNRYIEVYRAKAEDFLAVAGGNNNEAHQFLQKGGKVNYCIIRMRGLPYETTAEQVIEFFASHPSKTESNNISNNNVVELIKNNESNTIQDKNKIVNEKNNEEKMETKQGVENDLNNNKQIKDDDKDKSDENTIQKPNRPYCKVMDGGVLFVKRKDGRASGDAFVLFENEQEGQLALTKHRKLISTRYIELFRSSTAEVQQVFNRTIEQNSNNNNNNNNKNNQTSQYANSYQPIHHQLHNQIYQSTNLSLINQQQQKPTNGTTIQQPLAHLHHQHPNSVNYTGHNSFHQSVNGATTAMHQLSNNGNQIIQQQQHNLTSHINGNISHYQNNVTSTVTNNNYVHNLQSQQSQQILNSPPTTSCAINRSNSLSNSPSTINTSPINSSVNSLNTSYNGNTQLISCNKIASPPANNGNLMNRPPLYCIQPTSINQTTNATQFNRMRKDCIRLRGLPFEVNVDHVLEFLGDHISKQIVYQGIHMIYTLHGFSGEAFVQFNSEYVANQAAISKHHKYMHFGKKQRYIEVFQCSLDDMLLLLNCGQFISSNPNNINNNLMNGGLPIQRTLNTNIHAPTQYYYLQNHHLLSSRASTFYPPIVHPIYWPSTYYAQPPIY